MTGGWAATNTLREARAWLWREAENDAPPHGWRAREEVISNLDSAIALVEAALDAAGRTLTGMTELKSLPGVVGTIGTDDLDALAAALRAVREGA